jgi:hypothetical protein
VGFIAERWRCWPACRPKAAMLRKAAPMHDVGKIGIPDRVLKKPGPFDADERTVMNQHPEMGAHILGSSRIPCSAWPPRWRCHTTSAGTARATRPAWRRGHPAVGPHRRHRGLL